MSAVSTVSSIGNIYNSIAGQTRSKAADTSAATTTDSTSVSISEAARTAAKNDARVHERYKLPDYVTQWFNKDFPADVIEEAKARLADTKANGPIGAGGPMGLPLLPENQQLMDSFRAEMKAISSAGFDKATPEQAERYNLVMNLSMKLQISGWQRPMTEADVQREFDVANAMAKLSMNDPAPVVADMPERSPEEIIAEVQSGAVPGVWRQRWEKEGLDMPTGITLSPERSMWMDLARAADIGDEEFLAKARSLAGELRGSALTKAIETFISERYLAMSPETGLPAA